MRRSSRYGGSLRRTLASVGVLACVGAALSGAGAMSAASAQAGVASGSGPSRVDLAGEHGGSPGFGAAQDRDRIADAWTPQRMRAAIPLDLGVVAGVASVITPEAATRPARRAGADAVRATSKVPVPRSVGKLFFSDGGSDYVCSASAIDTPTRNLVLTAGHCVHTGADPDDSPLGALLGGLFGSQPHYFSDWIFVPRYKNGATPYGTWVAKAAWAPAGWRTSTDFAEDQAILKVAKLHGKRLVRVAGGNKVRYDAPRKHRAVRVWGWPAEDPFDGESSWRCDGPTRKATAAAPGDARMECNLNGGASGGPWMLKSGRTKNRGTIWAVTSRRSLSEPRLFAAPLGSAVERMIKAAS